MVIKHKSETVLEVQASTLTRNFIDSMSDIMKDVYADGTEAVLEQSYLLSNILEQMQKGEWTDIFKDGFTAMILSSDEMEYVDRFFQDKRAGVRWDRLTIHVNGDNGCWYVGEDSINF